MFVVFPPVVSPCEGRVCGYLCSIHSAPTFSLNLDKVRTHAPASRCCWSIHPSSQALHMLMYVYVVNPHENGERTWFVSTGDEIYVHLTQTTTYFYMIYATYSSSSSSSSSGSSSSSSSIYLKTIQQAGDQFSDETPSSALFMVVLCPASGRFRKPTTRTIQFAVSS